MRRWLPSLPLSAAVFVLWLLLVADLGVGQLLLAALLAWALPLVAARLQPERARFARPGVLLVLGRRVLWDMLLSNIEVARRILGPERALTPAFVWLPLELTSIHAITALASSITLTPAFVWLPLDLTNIHAITALASIITLTPGTVSAELSHDQRHLLVHCFNLKDADAMVAGIKARYEAPLKEIFP